MITDSKRWIGILENEIPQVISSWEDHFKSWNSFTKNYILFKYEEILSNPEMQIKRLIELTGEILELPKGFKVAIVPGSDTGAFELLMWSLLGKNETTMLAWESFGNDWAEDAVDQLNLADCRVHRAGYGDLPKLTSVARNADVCFTWNGTTSGVRVPNANWIEKNDDRLVLCDATSAVFSQELDWEKLDAASFSWQKVLGGEGGHGVIVLSLIHISEPTRPY